MRRILAAWLLALAASPLTAPFSIQDPVELFGGVGTHASAKKGVDDLSAAASPAVHTPVPGADWCLPGDARLPVPAFVRPHLSLPLRI